MARSLVTGRGRSRRRLLLTSVLGVRVGECGPRLTAKVGGRSSETAVMSLGTQKVSRWEVTGVGL